MGAVFQAVGYGNATSTNTLSVTMPAGVTSGMLLIANVTASATSQTWTGPAGGGWTGPIAVCSRGATFWKIAGGSEPGSYSFVKSGNSGTSRGAISSWTGHDASTPIQDSAAVDVTTANAVSPTVTATNADSVLFSALINGASNTTAVTQPSGMTSAFSTTTTAFKAGATLGVGAGATGTKTWTSPLATSAVTSMIINPLVAQSASATLASTSTLGVVISGQQTANAPLVSTSALAASALATRTASITLASTSAVAIYPATAFEDVATAFWTAITNRNSARVNIGMIGASLVEGYPCTADKTIQQYLAEKFRTAFPVTGDPHGYGYMGLPSSAMIGFNPWSITAGTGGAVGTASPANGWGGKHQVWYTGPLALSPILVLDLATMDTRGAWTSFDINLTRVSTYSATGGKYRIDGGSWVNFSLQTGAGAVVEKFHVASAVNSTLEISIESAATGSFVIVDGVVGYSGDEAKGFQVHGYGHSGYRVNQWQVDANPAYGYRQDQALQDLDLLILQDLGVNDAQTLSSATFRTNLSDWITYLKAVHTCPMVMIAVQDMSAQVSYVEPWSNYVAVMRELASANGIPFLDYDGLVPTYASDPSIYYTDHIHGATNGSMYSLMADVIYDFIAPPDLSADVPLVSTSTLAVAPRQNAQASVALASTSSLGVTGRQTAQSTATLASTSSLAVTGRQQAQVTAALASTSSLAVTGRQQVSQAATLASTSALAVTGRSTISSTAVLASTSTLSATALRAPVGTATLTSTSALAVTAVRVQLGAATFTSTSSLAVPGIQRSQGVAILISTSSLAVTIAQSVLASAVLASTSDLAVSGQKTTSGTATLASTSSLAVVTGGSISGSATLVSTSSLAVSGIQQSRPAVALASTSALSVTTGSTQSASPTLASTSTLAVTPAQQIPAAIPLASDSVIGIAARASTPASATLASTSSLAVVGAIQRSAAATLASTSTLIAITGGVAAAPLVSTSALSVTSRKNALALVDIASSSTLAVSGRATKSSVVALSSVSDLDIGGVRQVSITSANLVSTSALSVVGIGSPSAYPQFESVSTLSLAITAHRVAMVELESLSVLGASAAKLASGAVQFTSTSYLAVTGGAFTPGETGSSIIISGFQREISAISVIMGGTKKTVSGMYVIIGGQKKTATF